MIGVHSMNMKSWFKQFALAVAVAVVSCLVSAQTEFPQKPVRIVVPFPAGGSLDNLARLLSVKMAETLGQTVVVDPRPGGATVIGTQIVQRSAADGHTVLLMANGFLLTPMLMQQATWDPFKDFVPVSLLAKVNQVLVAHPSFKPNTLRELVLAAKAKPGAINFASFGNGTSSHLAIEIFKKESGIDITHVPYKGVAPALQDLLGGQVGLFLTNFPEVLAHVQSGRLKALAVADDKRLAQLPAVPTFSEQGYPNFFVYSWYGCVAPAGTPDPVVRKLHSAFSQALRSAEIARQLQQQGMVVLNLPSEELRQFMLNEQARYLEPVKATGTRID